MFSLFRPAKPTDVEDIFLLIQAAYKIEIGSTGLAFKSADRYTTRSAVIKDLPDLWVLRCSAPSSNNTSADKQQVGTTSRTIVGCAKASIDATNQIVDIGPLAVKPEHQVKSLSLQVIIIDQTSSEICLSFK